MPLLYYPSTNFPNDLVLNLVNQVEQISDKISKEQNVIITPGARVIIMNLLEAIIFDPSDVWDITEKERNEIYFYKLDTLNAELNNMINKNKIRNVTTYDLIHWLTTNLNDLCPINKRR